MSTMGNNDGLTPSLGIKDSHYTFGIVTSLIDGVKVPLTGTPTGALNVNLAASTTSATQNASGTITSGGASQQIAAADTSRDYFLLENVSDTDMWVDFGQAATAGQPSFLIKANGGSIELRGLNILKGTITVIGATTGKAFAGRTES